MTSYPCPYCRTPATSTTGCPGCGRGPDPDAAEVVRLDAEIPRLTAGLAQAQEAAKAADFVLRQAWRQREAAASRVRAAVAAAMTAPGPATGVAPGPSPAGGEPGSAPAAWPGIGLGAGPGASAGGGPGSAPAGSPEASTQLVQNALFLLGGLLLGVAAIVFTAVAWSQFGVGGRALLLAGFTVAALAVPPVALRRGLRATAETFAPIGLLLVLLDGYAAWYVNFFGVADYSAYGYAGAVCAVTAAVAAGYEHLTGLTGPRFAALIVAQPVLPLLAVPFAPDVTGWAYTLAAVTVVNLAVIHLRRGPLGPVGIGAYLLGGLAAGCAGLTALAAVAVAETPADAALAGSSLVTVALLVLAAALPARSTLAREAAGALLVLALAVAAGRFAAIAGTEFLAPLLVTAVVSALAGLVAALPAPVRRGPRIGALTALGVVALPALSGTAEAVLTHHADWRLPAAITLLTAALAGLLPHTLRLLVCLSGTALLALAAPAGFDLRWWSAPLLDLIVVALALALAVRRHPAWPASVAAVLTIHALAVAFDQPNVAAATLAAVAVLGIATATAARAGTLGGTALTIGLLAVPATAWTTADALRLAERPQTRAALAAVALLAGVLHLVARRWPHYRSYALAALLLAVLTAPGWAVASGDSPAIYAAVALLLIASTLPALASSPVVAGLPVQVASPVVAGLPVQAASPIAVTLLAQAAPPIVAAAAVAGVAFVAAVFDSIALAYLGPYAWLGQAWTGRPPGVGLTPDLIGRVTDGDVAAFAVLAAAVAVAAFARGGRDAVPAAALPVLAMTAPLAFAVAQVPWPGVQAASLLIGSAGLLWAALQPAARWVTGPSGSGVADSSGGRGVADSPGGRGVADSPGGRGAVDSPGGRGARKPGAGQAGSGTRGGASGGELGVAAVVVSAVLVGAGLAGSVATHGMTLAALGVTLVAGAIAGMVGREVPARVLGWLSAVGSALGIAFTAARAADLPLPTAAFAVLAAATAALALGSALSRRGAAGQGGATPAGRAAAGGSATEANPTDGGAAGAGSRRRAEGLAVQVAAHAGALVALLLTVGAIRQAAAVCTFWGLALGMRALLAGEAAAVRRRHVVAAAGAELGGWWLLLASQEVATVEAYTLPLAAVALLAGWLARRGRDDLSSWTGYGPALAAALLPTLASVLVAEGEPVRRLLLGLGALAVLLAGANFRLLAPVVSGGVVLALTALHEIALVWDRLPRWIPLAAAGLLLVGLAMTVERRRRDLARVRAALTRMT